MEQAAAFTRDNDRHENPIERIAQAALLFKGKLYTAAHHETALRKIWKEYPDWKEEYYDEIREGFVTYTGRFVDSKEAYQIADRAGQIIGDRNSGELDSVLDINLEGEDDLD